MKSSISDAPPTVKRNLLAVPAPLDVRKSLPRAKDSALDFEIGSSQIRKMKTYSAPYRSSVLSFDEPITEDIILTANKPVVVLVDVVLAEGRDDGSGIRPLEEGGDGILVQDTEGESKHEFDTVTEAREFARAQNDPDRNPVNITILEFRNGKWEVIESL